MDESLTLKADEVVLRENVLGNLLSNALKFSKENGVVNLGATSKGKQVIIYIKDHGDGIPMDIRKSLFDTSVKTSLEGTSGERGTGFELPIAKLFTEKVGGKLEFETKTRDESPGGYGTIFYIYLPMK